MALTILDGNQSATTLSTILSGGEHTPAHTVVSLGSTAISNITSAVSGSVVSVSNFPSTQTIAGTVTVGNSVTIGSLPAISGTVTANVAGNLNGAIEQYDDNGNVSHKVAVQIYGTSGQAFGSDASPLPVHGTITVGNTVTVAGTVTVGAMPNGSLTTRFGTPTTANTAFATSAVTNTSRKYLLIQNVTTGSNVITVGIGFTPTTTQGIQLTAGAGITFESSYIPTGAVMILSSVTASNYTILEA